MGTATATRTATQTAPCFDRLAPALREQLTPLLLDLVSRLTDSELQGLRRFVGLRVAGGKGRPTTARVLTAFYLGLMDGPQVVNVSAVARNVGVSRPTVYRALRYASEPRRGRPKLLRLDPRSTGPSRPGRWEIRPDILGNPTSQRLQEYAPSAASVNSKGSRDSEPTTRTSRPTGGPESPKNLSPLLGAARPPLGTPSRTTDPGTLLAWLDSPALDLDRVPTFNERRKLAAAVRLAACPRLADPVLSALFWRKSLPLHAWRTAVRSLIDAAAADPERFQPPRRDRHLGARIVEIGDRVEPSHWSRQSRRELDWRARLAMTHLRTAPSDRPGFLNLIEHGPARTDAATVARIRGLSAQIDEETAELDALRESYAEATSRLSADELRRDGFTCRACFRTVARGDWTHHSCWTLTVKRRSDLRALRARLLGELADARDLTPDEAAELLPLARGCYDSIREHARHRDAYCPYCAQPIRLRRATTAHTEQIQNDRPIGNGVRVDRSPHDCARRLAAAIAHLEIITEERGNRDTTNVDD